MFHNVLMTSLTPLCNTNEIQNWDNRPFTTSWPEDRVKQKQSDFGKITKKKCKRYRTIFTTQQLICLEETYSKSKYINAEHRRELSSKLNLKDKAIKIWFQNKRMKDKKESSEASWSSSSEDASSVSAPTPNGNQYIKVEDSQNQYPESNIVSPKVTEQSLDNIIVSESQGHGNYINYGDVGEYQNLVAPVIYPTSHSFKYDINTYPTDYYPAYTMNYNLTSVEGSNPYYPNGSGSNWDVHNFDGNNYF